MDNIEIVHKVYDAFKRQDLEGLLTLVDPDCVVTQDESLPWGGRNVGHDGVTAFAFARWELPIRPLLPSRCSKPMVT